MNDHPFYRLAPFIQEYLYTHGWTELRAVQVEACRVIFETDAHLLLATGTASGKTEAAFLPALTLLHERPAASIGILYIGPTKALINDQFFRLSDLLTEARTPVWEWHGDVSQSQKARLLKNPTGVLQITPESLESLLINRTADLARLFGDLRFVVIDEVHVFMGSDRGRQVLCQLARLSRFVREEPRRIGLSATLGEYSIGEQWLASGSKRLVITPSATGGSQRIRLAVEHFTVANNPTDDPTDGLGHKHRAADDADGARDLSIGLLAGSGRLTGRVGGIGAGDTTQPASYFRYLFEQTKGRKCLIFANSRGETEQVIAAMRHMADAERLPDIYHVHHGSIAAPLREAAEAAMRDPSVAAVIAATITLELGIDIGQLERVIQLHAPFSVSSFLQRLGRSGRRGNPSELWLICPEDQATGQENLPQQIPWDLLQAIAVIQLYVEERWIEPIHPTQYPFSLLYHQTMSTLMGMGELSASALAQRVLTLPPFQHVSHDDFRTLLRHLVEIDHIQSTDERGLIVGLAGEKVVRDFRFYAVFPDNEEYLVRDETREIGSIVLPPPPGERFALAGRTWECLEIDLQRRTVFVRMVKGAAEAAWQGSGGAIHRRVLERMRRVLLEETMYPYLQVGAARRLTEARRLAKTVELERRHVFPLGGNLFCVIPWMGSVEYRTLDRYFRHMTQNPAQFVEPVRIGAISGLSPYYFMVRLHEGDAAALLRAIVSLVTSEVDIDSLLGEDEAPQLQKYDEFIPRNLLRKAFAVDYLDVLGLKALVEGW